DDTRRGKRMMGMILGTLTQFKRQSKTAVPPRVAVPTTSVNATAVVEKAEVSSRSVTKISTTITEAVATTSRRDDVDRGHGRDDDNRGARDDDSRSNGESRRDGDSRGGRDSDNTRKPNAPALETRGPSALTTDAAPPSVSAAETGRTSREAVEERVREKLRLEKEANEDRLRKERADREARLRETLLKQIAGRSSVPGRRRNVAGAPTATVTGQLSTTPTVHLSRRSRDTRYENGYLMTETKPRLRYMPKVMNESTREKFNRQVEDNPDQRAIPKRGAPPPPRREDADVSSSKSKTAPAASASAAGGKGGERRETNDRRMQEDRDYDDEDDDEQPSAEAVAKAEAEAERELDAGMNLDLDGSADDDIRRESVPLDSTWEEAQKSAASESLSATVPRSPATTRDGSEDVAMEG
ncbi:hypothetical protein BG015_005049, partial [Linnemannia schmuckeri]